MKKGLLLISALTFGIVAGQAQLSKLNKLDKKASTTLEKVKPSYEKKVAPTFQTLKKDVKNATRRAGDVTVHYLYPDGVFYYGLSDEGSRYTSVRMITGAYDDILFKNYTNDGSKILNDVTWKWAYSDGEEVNPIAQDVDEKGNLTAQAYGFMPFPTLTYGGQDFSIQAAEGNYSYWNAGSEGIVEFSFSDGKGGTEVEPGTVGNFIPALGMYSGFGEPLDLISNNTFYNLENYKTTGQPNNTGKKLIGFAEYYVKPASTVYTTGISTLFWYEDVTTSSPFNGKQLTATIYTFNGDKLVPYATAIAKESNFVVLSEENKFSRIDFNFVENDPVLGEVESPITLPDEDFIVMLEGFDQLTGKFQSPIISSDGWADCYGYVLLEDGSLNTVGYMNDPETPQISLPIGFRAAFPVAHYASDNMPKVLFEAEGGLGAGMYDEEKQQFVGYVMISSMTPKDEWSEEECPEWVTYQLDDQYVEQYGIMLVELTAEALPTGVDSREGTVVLDVYGKKVEIPVYQAAGAITSISNTTMKVNVSNGQFFNMAGQRVSEGFKGLVVKDGKKYIAK